MTNNGNNPGSKKPNDNSLKHLQRRHLSVMFVDLVGSTKLSRELDPEDLAEVILNYQNCVEVAVGSYGGNIVRYVGDGILVLFGWPLVPENAPESSVRAADQIHKSLAKLESEYEQFIECHIGIASGWVAVGDVVTSAGPQLDVVFGETPNLAARLQSIAKGGQTVISSNLQYLTRDICECRKLHDTELTGFDAQQEAFLVEALIQTKPQFKETFSTAIVGRDPQSSRLRRLWDRVSEGDGQIVLLSGEAGIGKSRLIYDQRGYENFDPERFMLYQCSSFDKVSAYFPFVRYFESQSGATHLDSQELRMQKVVARFSEQLSEQHLDVISAIVAPSQANTAVFNEANENNMRAQLADALLAVLREKIKNGPVLIHFEDIHWIDPSSNLILKELRNKIAKMPVLCVLTFRPEFSVDDFNGKHVHRIRLAPLSREHCRNLIRKLDVARALQNSEIETILAQSNGVPLFVEHCTATASAGLQDTSAIETKRPSGAHIPEPIYDRLMHNMNLPKELHDVALVCAALGENFDSETVSGIIERSQNQVEDALFQLVKLGVLKTENAPSGLQLAFRHALVGKAAYQSMVKKRRIELHRKIAHYYQTEHPSFVERRPEVLAYHLEAGEEIERAVDCWMIAAHNSIRHLANREADAHALNGLALLDRLQSDMRDQKELRLQSLRATALQAYRGYGAEENIKAMQRAFFLSEKMGEKQAILRSGHGLFSVYQITAQFDAGVAIGKRISRLVNESHGQMIAHYIQGTPLNWQGEFRKSHEALVKAENFGVQHVAESEPGKADTNATIQIQVMLGLTEAHLGLNDLGVKRSFDAIALSEEFGRTLTIANAYHIACHTLLLIRHSEIENVVSKLYEFAKRFSLPFYTAVASCIRGGAAGVKGEWSLAHELFMNGYTAMTSAGCISSGPISMAELAEIERQLGKFEDALAAIDKGLGFVEKYGEHNYEAELYRLRGVILSDYGEPIEQVEHFLEKSLDLANAQGARLFTLRAATDILERTNSGPIRYKAGQEATRILNEMPNFAGPDAERAKSFLS